MILKIQQQTPEWLQKRCGRVTGSRVADVMSRLKNGSPSAKRAGYLMEIVEERLTGRAADHYVSDAMAWGAEHESLARAAYEIATDNEVERVGMAIHPRIEMFSASPDGSVGPKGLFEAKCPTTQTHIGWLLNGVMPPEYKDQCLAEMACWEREFVDFVSFDPRVPPSIELFQPPRFERDEKRIAEIEFSVVEFLAEADEIVARLLKSGDLLKERLRRSVEENDFTAEMEADIAATQKRWAEQE